MDARIDGEEEWNVTRCSRAKDEHQNEGYGTIVDGVGKQEAIQWQIDQSFVVRSDEETTAHIEDQADYVERCQDIQKHGVDEPSGANALIEELA